MILGRSTTLWLGLVTAVVGAATVSLIALGFDAVVVGTLAGAFGGVAGSAIALIAGQPPTLAAGDVYKIATPEGQPNYEATVKAPPQPTTPTVDPEP